MVLSMLHRQSGERGSLSGGGDCRGRRERRVCRQGSSASSPSGRARYVERAFLEQSAVAPSPDSGRGGSLQRAAEWCNFILTAFHVHCARDERQHLQCTNADLSRCLHHDLHAVFAFEQSSRRPAAAAATATGGSGAVGAVTVANLNLGGPAVPSPQLTLSRV